MNNWTHEELKLIYRAQATIGTAPRRISQPTEDGYYWVKSVSVGRDFPLTVHLRGKDEQFGRYNWDKAKASWDIVWLHEGSIDIPASDEGVDWYSQWEVPVAIGPRIYPPDCPECGGLGELTYDVLVEGTEHSTVTAKCRECRGLGSLSQATAELP